MLLWNVPNYAQVHRDGCCGVVPSSQGKSMREWCTRCVLWSSLCPSAFHGFSTEAAADTGSQAQASWWFPGPQYSLHGRITGASMIRTVSISEDVYVEIQTLPFGQGTYNYVFMCTCVFILYRSTGHCCIGAYVPTIHCQAVRKHRNWIKKTLTGTWSRIQIPRGSPLPELPPLQKYRPWSASECYFIPFFSESNNSYSWNPLLDGTLATLLILFFALFCFANLKPWSIQCHKKLSCCKFKRTSRACLRSSFCASMANLVHAHCGNDETWEIYGSNR